MRKNLAAHLALGLLLGCGPGLLRAQTIGNPVPSTAPGAASASLAVERFNRDLQIDGAGTDDLDFTRVTFQTSYGESKGAVAKGYLSLVRARPDGGDTFSGQELGIGYRKTIDVNIPIGDEGIETAILGDVRYGFLDDGESFNYLQLDLGFGGSYPVSKRLNAYGGILYSEIWGKIGSREVNADDNLGFWGGAEFEAAEALRLSGELHVLHEFGIAVIIQYDF